MSANAVKVKVEVPARISTESRENASRAGKEAVVLSLWQAGEISTREAAAELDMIYYDFLDLLAARGIPVAGSFDPEALERAKRLLGDRARS